MSTDVNVLDKNPVSTPVSSSMTQPQIGSLNKEAPRVTGLSELQPAGQEARHDINQDLKELGMEEKIDRPDLTQVVDIQHAGPHVPVSTFPSGKVSLPMSEEEVADKLNTGRGDDSGKWLAGLIRKIIKVMGL